MRRPKPDKDTGKSKALGRREGALGGDLKSIVDDRLRVQEVEAPSKMLSTLGKGCKSPRYICAVPGVGGQNMGVMFTENKYRSTWENSLYFSSFSFGNQY